MASRAPNNQLNTPFPPMRLGPSRTVSTAEAQTHIAAFLASAAKKPYMLPNAKLLASGPSAQGATNGGLVLNNLRRLEAGLRGEVMAPSLDIGGGNGRGKGEEDDVMKGVEFENQKKGKGINVDDMWAEAQDINEYQREQSIGEGEIGAGQAGESMGVKVVPEVVDTTKTGGAVDKAARKAAKKARNKDQKKEKKQRV